MHVPLAADKTKMNHDDSSLTPIILAQIKNDLFDLFRVVRTSRDDLMCKNYNFMDVLKYCLIDIDDVILQCSK